MVERTWVSARAVAALLLALLAGACTVGPDYRRPDVSLPAAYPGAAAPTPAAPAAGAWWTGFDDPVLAGVVERALAQNLDLEAARARIAEGRAAAHAAGAALLPSANLQASASQQELSLYSPFGAIVNEAPELGLARSYTLYDVGAAASWEVDLFGGLRRARQAARAEAEAAEDDAAAVRVSVAAEAADAYLQVLAYRTRSAVARRQEEVERRLVALLQQRRGDGVASDRELRQATAALEGVQATLPPLQAGEEGQLDRLDVLLGAPAGARPVEIGVAANLPSPPSLAGLGAPADLLRRRPDVLAAERRLRASDARIGQALAGYYPALSVTGLLGIESVDTSRLFISDALQHTVSGALRWRLFDFGRVDAEVAQARGREAEALATYRRTVYQATGEVGTALADLVGAERRAEALRRQIEDLDRARAEAEIAYKGGVVSLVEVLDADRDLLAASDQLAQARADAARSAVAAFRATGGGVRTETLSTQPAKRLSAEGST